MLFLFYSVLYESDYVRRDADCVGDVDRDAKAVDDIENEQLVSSPPLINSNVSSRLSTFSLIHLSYASIGYSAPKMSI